MRAWGSENTRRRRVALRATEVEPTVKALLYTTIVDIIAVSGVGVHGLWYTYH